MRLIGMLITLLIVGMLIYKQIGVGTKTESDTVQSTSEGSVPRVPTNPQDLKTFEKQMNDYMQEEADKRADKIEDTLSK